MSDFVTELRAELVTAAEREQVRRRPRMPRLAPRTLVFAATAVAAAALIVVLAVGGLRVEPNRVQTPAGQPTPESRELFGGSLEDGVRYQTRRFIPSLSFVASGDNWETFDASGEDTLGLALRRVKMVDGLRIEGPPVGFLFFQRIPQLYDPGVQDLDRSLAAAPADLYAWLRAHPDLRVGDRRDVTVGGVHGISFDVAVQFDRPAHADPACRERFLRTCTYIAPNVSLFNGDDLGVTILDTEPDPLVIAVGGETPERVQKVARAAQPMLDTLRIGER